MKTQIIGVLGLGIFGQTIATELSSFGQDVIALDNNSTTIDSLADQVTKAAVGDITDIDFLRSAGIDTCDTVIIATGEHLESSALALLIAYGIVTPIGDRLQFAQAWSYLYAQSFVAGVANFITIAIGGTLLLAIYAGSRTQSGSLTKD